MVKMEKGLGSTAAGKYLHTKYKENPNYLHTGIGTSINDSFMLVMSIKVFIFRDLNNMKSRVKETFTHGSVRSRWWNPGRDSD